MQGGAKLDGADAAESEKPLAQSCSSYASGERRPRFRGAIHFGASVVAGSAILMLLIPAASDCRMWPLVLFLCGKLCSYSISAFYHMSRTTASCPKQQQTFLAADMVCVSATVLATGVPFADRHFELYYGFSLTLLVLVVLTVSAGTLFLKNVAVLVQILFSVSFIGVSSQFCGMWALSTALSLMAVVCYLPVMLRKGGGALEEAVLSWVPWHERGVYGCWEDFHALSVAADVCFFATATVHVSHLRC